MITNLAANASTPIGFFSLIVLAVESILGGLALLSSPEDKTFIIRNMIYILFLVILIVTILVYTKPEYFIKGNSHKSVKKNAHTLEQEQYDLFISSPMASLKSDQEYKEQRYQMLELINSLQNTGKFKKIFYPGLKLLSNHDFENEIQFATDKNFQVIDNSNLFLLIYPEQLSSSVLVEAGYAIAKEKPSIFFVRDTNDLPYLLSNMDGLRNIRIYKYNTIENIIHLIDENGDKIFPKLNQN